MRHRYKKPGDNKKYNWPYMELKSTTYTITNKFVLEGDLHYEISYVKPYELKYIDVKFDIDANGKLTSHD